MSKEIKISYSYDALNRLSGAVINDGPGRNYQYDAAGNLVAVSDPETETKAAAADAATDSTDPRFVVEERKYAAWKQMLEAGSITPDQFVQEINQLRFEDGLGVWWQLSSEGQWLRWDGKAWTEP